MGKLETRALLTLSPEVLVILSSASLVIVSFQLAKMKNDLDISNEKLSAKIETISDNLEDKLSDIKINFNFNHYTRK